MSIETNRLMLVIVSENHIKEIFKNFTEEIIKYMIPTVARDINETTRVVHRFIEQRLNETDYVYAITLKSTGEFMGLVGLHNLKNEVPVLGIWTKLNAHGNHYGREAIGGVIEYARSLGIKKLHYPVDRRNIPSVKIPLYFSGKLVKEYHEIETPDGRILEEEIYEIKI